MQGSLCPIPAPLTTAPLCSVLGYEGLWRILKEKRVLLLMKILKSTGFNSHVKDKVKKLSYCQMNTSCG